MDTMDTIELWGRGDSPEATLTVYKDPVSLGYLCRLGTTMVVRTWRIPSLDGPKADDVVAEIAACAVALQVNTVILRQEDNGCTIWGVQ